MSRRMSCALTVDAVKARTKTITRREATTWATTRVGDELTLIEKGMGLSRGEKQKVLTQVIVEDTVIEPLLSGIIDDGTASEGFPGWDPLEFAVFWADGNGFRKRLREAGLRLAPDPTVPPDAERARTIWETLGGVQCRKVEWSYIIEDDNLTDHLRELLDDLDEQGLKAASRGFFSAGGNFVRSGRGDLFSLWVTATAVSGIAIIRWSIASRSGEDVREGDIAVIRHDGARSQDHVTTEIDDAVSAIRRSDSHTTPSTCF